MHELVSFDGKIVPAANAGLSSLSSAALYGKGVFTSIAIYDGTPFLWTKHWRRLEDNAAKVGIDISEYGEEETKYAVETLIAENRIKGGRARITFFDGRSSSIWPFESDKKTSLLIMTGDLRPAPDNFRMTISRYPVNSRSPLAGVKSCNYLENLLAFEKAKDRRSNEAIRVNERGDITSGCMANVFWLNQGRLYTPSLATGCLAGTTREFVLENLDCDEVEAGIEVLDNAEAIYLTSAGLGIVQASEFETKQLKITEHPILSLLPKRI